MCVWNKRRFIHVLCLWFFVFFFWHSTLYLGNLIVSLRKSKYNFQEHDTWFCDTQSMGAVFTTQLTKSICIFSLWFCFWQKTVSVFRSFLIFSFLLRRRVCVTLLLWCYFYLYQTFEMSCSSPIVSDITLFDAFDFEEVVLIRISFNLLKSHYKCHFVFTTRS